MDFSFSRLMENVKQKNVQGGNHAVENSDGQFDETQLRPNAYKGIIMYVKSLSNTLIRGPMNK